MGLLKRIFLNNDNNGKMIRIYCLHNLYSSNVMLIHLN